MRGGASIRRLWPAALIALALLCAPALAGASVGPFAMSIQPDGKIVVAGGAGHEVPIGSREFGAVMRYLPSGRLDRSFGGGDGVTLLPPAQPFTAIAIQRDGRIVVASPVGGQGGLVRLLPSGNLDLRFGEKGFLYGGASTAYYPTSVKVDRKGRIFVGGMTGYLNDVNQHWYGWLYRVSANGRSGDRIAGMTNGENGQPRTVINDFVFGEQGVLSAGTIGERGSAAETNNAVLARLVPGTAEADPSFGGGVGLVRSNVYPASTEPETANALAWQGEKLLIAGEANSDLLVSRYSADGLLDMSFGRRGFNTVGFGPATDDRANALAVDLHGGIVAAGSSSHGCASGCDSLLLARYGKNGQPVKKFGRGGIVSPAVDRGRSSSASETAYAVGVRGQGRILVGGVFATPGSSRLFLRRYLADGTPDRSFGKRGRVATLPVAAERAR
ncbi:MAG TPA: hypothetical protein VFU11_13340 [Solirubrobacterales bacterium]|nr:hypothetical protein [Solirubrobacterales bacterium]